MIFWMANRMRKVAQASSLCMKQTRCLFYSKTNRGVLSFAGSYGGLKKAAPTAIVANLLILP